MKKYTLNDIALVTKSLTTACALSFSLLVSLPGYTQVDLPSVTVTADPLPPGDWGLIGGGSQDPGNHCNHIGCNSNTTGADDDASTDGEEELDITCISSTQQIGPLTLTQVESYQNIVGALESAVIGLAGAAAGVFATSVGAGGGATIAYTVATSTLADLFLDPSSNYWCGQITKIKTTICFGPDIDQMGGVLLSDFWGDHVANTETAQFTGICIDDRNLGSGNF